jgi:hypothetical protein
VSPRWGPGVTEEKVQRLGPACISRSNEGAIPHGEPGQVVGLDQENRRLTVRLGAAGRRPGKHCELRYGQVAKALVSCWVPEDGQVLQRVPSLYGRLKVLTRKTAIWPRVFAFDGQ